MKLSKLSRNVTNIAKKHGPEILTGMGIAGMIATTVMAVKATPKALLIINEKEATDHVNKLNAAEVVKATWKCYIPAIITGTASVICIISASSVNAKRNAALVTAYTLSETAMREYKDKVIETIGEKKEQEVRDKIAKDRIDKNPVTNNNVVITNHGETLCYDLFSGRYFKSDINELKRIVNELNSQMLKDTCVTLNDFYYEIGLDNTKMGETLGWDANKDLIELSFTSELASDGTPCLAIDFINPPTYDF